MAAPVPPIIIVKKIRKRGHGGHHGGAWKIAYADFVTAMMAFFLLMWLLSFTDPGTKAGIAAYFNRPLQSLLTAGPAAAPTSEPQTPDEKKKEKEKVDKAKLEELKKKLDTVTESNPKLKAFKNQIKIEITSEGLRVTIVDQKKRPMFAVGSAVLEDYTKVILDQMGPTLNEVDNPISISGHTDSLEYAGGEKGYSNWELSSDRANAARRELIANGMSDKKIIQIRGLAGSMPLNKDASNPSNRRISIVVLNQDTVERLKLDGATAAGSETGAPAATASAGPEAANAAAPPATPEQQKAGH